MRDIKEKKRKEKERVIKTKKEWEKGGERKGGVATPLIECVAPSVSKVCDYLMRIFENTMGVFGMFFWWLGNGFTYIILSITICLVRGHR